MHFVSRYGSSHGTVKLARRLYANRQFSSQPRLQQDAVLGPYIAESVPNPFARNIAVLGGGPSGLATAFNLTKDIPHAKITVFEAKDRIGGWVNSELVEVNDGHALFEWGPRTLRPAVNGPGIATLQLMWQLGSKLTSQILRFDRKSPAATNRYVYYPDHLVRMPALDPNRGLISNISNIVKTMSEPMFAGVFKALLSEYRKDLRSKDVSDESVGHFLRRRFGASITDNIASAFFSGIYAGDIYKLSMATVLPKLWYQETRDVENKGGVMLEIVELIFRGQVLEPLETVRFINYARQKKLENPTEFSTFIAKLHKDVVAYTFTKGIGQLVEVLIEALKENTNVTLKTSTRLQELSFDKTTNRFSLHDEASTEVGEFDHVVSSLSPEKLGQLIQTRSGGATQIPVPDMPNLYKSPDKLKAVNAMVVNLYYKSTTLPIPRGFGYLIPRSLPLEQNPERALGVLFASETSGERRQGSVPVEDVDDQETAAYGQDSASGTKLAVIIGGHWWDGWSEKDLPSEEDGIEMAKSVIARHLKVTEEPIVAKARLQKECIPQYHVGYREHMGKIHQELLDAFDGRLKVMGTWWQGGVGLNDCMQAAQETSRRIRYGLERETGLERYAQAPKFVLADRRTRRMVIDPLNPSRRI